MPQKLILILGCFVLMFSGLSQIPPGYYNSAMGLSGEPLKAALNDIIDGHIEFPYTSSSTDTWDILKLTDQDTINPNNVVLLYSGWTMNAALEYDGGNGWSREHVWPQSRGDFGTLPGPGTDVHALRPADIGVNEARGNRWFAACNEPYGTTGSFTSSTEWVWQPRDAVKGDVARMIFYMATRYEGENGELDLELIDFLPSNNFTTAPIHAKLSDLYQWHLEDPVDDWERRRNDIIYYNFQNNRNPYIDHPEFVAKIWGPTAGLTNPTLSTNPKLIKVIDFLGREVTPQPNVPLIFIYDDGSTVKRVLTE
jgi:endonuclease I